MAFESKTWADRLSQYPNRRKIKDVENNSESIVDITREEGNIYSSGTSFSAKNMNDLEARIASMFPVSIENGGTGGTTATEARQNLDSLSGNILYEGLSGTQGTIYLSDSAANYKYFEIYFTPETDDTNVISSTKVYKPDGKNVELYSANCSTKGLLHIKVAYITISGDTITWKPKSAVLYTDGTSTGFNRDNVIAITTVVGYSY